jgi:hypothetical protein
VLVGNSAELMTVPFSQLLRADLQSLCAAFLNGKAASRLSPPIDQCENGLTL